MSSETLRRAIALCAEFLSGNWTSENAVEAKLLPGVHSNLTVLCSLTDEYRDEQTFPWDVVVRQIFGKHVLQTMDVNSETLAYAALANAGIGPKLLGVFEDGRIEEFINGRHLLAEELYNPVVLTAIAKGLARMHSLELPLRRSPKIFEGRLRNYVSLGESSVRHSSFVKDVRESCPELAEKLEDILKMDITSSLDSVFMNLSTIPSRVVCLTHVDHHVGNIMVKNKKEACDITEDDLVNIDIELGCYFYRGHDIGFILHERAFHKQGKLAEDLEHLFIREYLSKWIKLNPKKYDEQLDTFENVLLEMHFGSLVTGHYLLIQTLKKIVEELSAIDIAQLDRLLRRIEVDSERKEKAFLLLKAMSKKC